MSQNSGSLHAKLTAQYLATTADRGFTATAQHYDNAATSLRRRLAAWLPVDRTGPCLDLACGLGELVFMLERDGFRNVVGVDLCEAEVKAGATFVNSPLINDDILAYLRTEKGNSVVLITALNILEHLSKDVLSAVFTECERVLVPGGTMIAMVPNAISPFGSLTRHWDLTHEWAFTPNNFRQLAALHRFEVPPLFRECGPVIHGFRSFLRYTAWRTIRLAIAAWFLIELGDRKGGVYTMDMLVRLRKPAS